MDWKLKSNLLLTRWRERQRVNCRERWWKKVHNTQLFYAFEKRLDFHVDSLETSEQFKSKYLLELEYHFKMRRPAESRLQGVWKVLQKVSFWIEGMAHYSASCSFRSNWRGTFNGTPCAIFIYCELHFKPKCSWFILTLWFYLYHLEIK